jgi:hypothetical protein
MLDAIGMGVFKVDVAISGGCHPAEFWAKQASDKIMSVSDTAPPEIREQAVAFKNRIEAVVLYYIKEAVKENNSMVLKTLTDAGHPQLADLLRSV